MYEIAFSIYNNSQEEGLSPGTGKDIWALLVTNAVPGSNSGIDKFTLQALRCTYDFLTNPFLLVNQMILKDVFVLNNVDVQVHSKGPAKQIIVHIDILKKEILLRVK